MVGRAKAEEVGKWLSGQRAYTLHAPVRRKFRRNRIVVHSINEQFQADLADMTTWAKKNDGYKYLLTCIDVFSKYAWVVPLKVKTGTAVKQAFEEHIFSERKPEKLQTDQGKEFVNSTFREYLKEQGVEHFFSLSAGEVKCAVVERFNRTLKSKMWKYFTYKNDTRRYIDVLPDLVHSYNHTYHSVIKMAPASVTDANVKQVWQNMYGKYFETSVMDEQKRRQRRRYKFSVGDHVRLSGERIVFRKGYEQGWTEEIYTVCRRMLRDPPVYVVKDEQDEELQGVFYDNELQRVVKPDVYIIEQVLKTRGVGNQREYFVKWQGYPKKFNQWVKHRDVVDQ